MKKRFSVIITAVLALIMSFTLFACGAPDGEPIKNPGNAPDKATAVQTALASFENYVGAVTQGGEFGYELDTEKTEPLGGSFEFVKSGERVFYTVGENADKKTRMLDVRHGLNYVKTESGWVYDRALYPQGTPEYVAAVVAAAGNGQSAPAAPDFSLDELEYDAKARTLTLERDHAQQVNRALSPISEVYESEGSVVKLIDEYINEYYAEITEAVPEIKALISPPVTLYKLCTFAKTMLPDVKDKKIADMMPVFGMTADDYKAFLTELGLTGEAYDDASVRTFGEAFEGVLAYVNAKLDIKKITAGDLSSVKALVGSFISDDPAVRAQAIGEILQYVLVSEVDVTDFEKDAENIINTVYDLLDRITVKSIVDGAEKITVPGMSTQFNAIVGMGATVVKEAIVTGTKFTALEYKVVFELDEKYALGGVRIELYAAHNYTGNKNLPVLSDNGYSAKLIFSPTSYSNVAEPEITFAPETADGFAYPELATAIMRLDAKDNTSVYLDTRMFGQVEVTVLGAQAVDGNGKGSAVDGVVSYDEKTGSFVFDAKAVKAMAAEYVKAGNTVKRIDVRAVVSYGEKDAVQVGASVLVVPDASAEAAGALVADIMAQFKKPDDLPSV